MATELRLKIGQVTATRTFASDAKTAPLLRLYAESIGVPQELTDQEKLQRILDHWVAMVQFAGRDQYIRAQEQRLRAEANALGLE